MIKKDQRGDKLREVEALKRQAEARVGSLDPADKQDRKALNSAANDWLKADPKRINRRRAR